MIEYLQDITHRSIVLDGADGCELLPAEVEVALGCGEEAAIICMQAADYEQSPKSGRWFSKHCAPNPQLIRVPETALSTYFRLLSEVV